MTYPPKARVLVSPLTDGPARAALVVSKVNGVDAYCVRTSDGRRATVAGSQLRPNRSPRR